VNEHPRDSSPAIDVPEADALDQRDDQEERPPAIPIDVPEADALEQARDADLDEEEYQP
jgi:hypothetical protein